jgi:peptidoglycan/LPS O-acetylase OafA/YrhL
MLDPQPVGRWGQGREAIRGAANSAINRFGHNPYELLLRLTIRGCVAPRILSGLTVTEIFVAVAMPYDARRINHLDGLRGLAAVVVVVFHYLSAFVPALTPDQTGYPYWLSDTPLAVLFNGPFAVVVFFVLSGFVVSKAAAHKSDPLPLTIVLRYLRLTIPMLVSVLIAWLLLTTFPTEAIKLESITGTPWLSSTFNGVIPSLLQAIKDATYDVYRHGVSRFNNVMWSMKWELIGSVAIYGIYAFFHRSVYIIATFIAVFVLLLWKGPPYYFEAFVFGVLMQEAWTHSRLKQVAPTIALTIGLILGSQGTGFAHRYGLDFLPLALRPGEKAGMIYPIAAALVVYGCLISVPVSKFLQQKQCLFLGRISFGLYLIHVPIAYTVVMAVAVLLWPMSAITLWVGLLIFIALSIGLGWLMTILVDAPGLQLLSLIRKFAVSPVRISKTA